MHTAIPVTKNRRRGIANGVDSDEEERQYLRESDEEFEREQKDLQASDEDHHRRGYASGSEDEFENRNRLDDSDGDFENDGRLLDSDDEMQFSVDVKGNRRVSGEDYGLDSDDGGGRLGGGRGRTHSNERSSPTYYDHGPGRRGIDSVDQSEYFEEGSSRTVFGGGSSRNRKNRAHLQQRNNLSQLSRTPHHHNHNQTHDQEGVRLPQKRKNHSPDALRRSSKSRKQAPPTLDGSLQSGLPAREDEEFITYQGDNDFRMQEDFTLHGYGSDASERDGGFEGIDDARMDEELRDLMELDVRRTLEAEMYQEQEDDEYDLSGIQLEEPVHVYRPPLAAIFEESEPGLSTTDGENEQFGDNEVAVAGLGGVRDIGDIGVGNDVDQQGGDRIDGSLLDDGDGDGGLFGERNSGGGNTPPDLQEQQHPSYNIQEGQTATREAITAIHGFDYMGCSDTPLKTKEFISYALYRIRQHRGLSRKGLQDITALLKLLNLYSDNPNAPLNDKTIEKRIFERTGIQLERYDVCEKNCYCFTTERRDGDVCPNCNGPRLQPNGTPWRTFDYIPITHRLKLQYSNKERARTLMTYRQLCTTTDTDQLKDFWDGDLYKDLVKSGLFKSATDMGFFFSTDGVAVFDTRTLFSVHPLVLINLNLPPEERYHDDNVFLLGCIPGPKKPQLSESFLVPFIREMRALEKGIPHVYNAYTGKTFVMRAHLCVVGADMPERENLMRSTGTGSYTYCPYCKIRGFGNGSQVYCPLRPPTNNLPDISKLKKVSQSLKDIERGIRPTTYNALDLPKRTHTEYHTAWVKWKQLNGDPKVAADTAGIKGVSIFCRLKSIRFPRSFPPDAMHLWFENVIPNLFNHWRGRYYSIKGGTVYATAETSATATATGDTPNGMRSGDEADESGNDTAQSSAASNGSARTSTRGSQRGTRGRGRGRGRSRDKSRRGGRSGGQSRGGSNVAANSLNTTEKSVIAKFVQTDDRFCISPEAWSRIGTHMDKTRESGLIPTSYGYNIRSIYTHYHHWKAEEWKHWALRYSTIYLKGVLPETFYRPYVKLVEAIRMSNEYSILRADVEDIRKLIAEFYRHYEKEYYQFDYTKLSCCRSVFHQILHVADFLLDCGPSYVYSQWLMERVCGAISRGVTQKRETNRNISLNMQRHEAINHLMQVTSVKSLLDSVPSAELYRYSPVEGEISPAEEGALRLHRFLYNLLRRPDPALSALNMTNGLATGRYRREEQSPSTQEATSGSDGRVLGTMMFEGKGKKLAKVDNTLRLALRESKDQHIWTQCENRDWEDFGVRKYKSVVFSSVSMDAEAGSEEDKLEDTEVNATSMRISSSAFFKQDGGSGTQTRKASYVYFLANVAANSISRKDWPPNTSPGDLIELRHVGEVVYFFDLEPLVETSVDEPGYNNRIGVLARNATLTSLALVKSFNLQSNGSLRYVDNQAQGGKHLVVPASAVQELLAFVSVSGRYYVCEYMGGCSVAPSAPARA